MFNELVKFKEVAVNPPEKVEAMVVTAPRAVTVCKVSFEPVVEIVGFWASPVMEIFVPAWMP